MNYYYLSDGTKTSAVTDAGTGLIYRGPFTYRTAADGTLSLESAAVPQGRLTPVVFGENPHSNRMQNIGAKYYIKNYDKF